MRIKTNNELAPMKIWEKKSSKEKKKINDKIYAHRKACRDKFSEMKKAKGLDPELTEVEWKMIHTGVLFAAIQASTPVGSSGAAAAYLMQVDTTA
eukprot:12926296-Prorocentrum_lima.AAC.1